jgi:4-hydroxybenzoate polyprenyltransferase
MIIVAFLRLIRLPNLVLIALTQYLVRYCLMVHYNFDGSVYIKEHIPYTLDNLHFFILVFSTLLVAAAGYIINDYFDTKIDRINKPHKVIVERFIDRNTAIFLHILLSAAAVAGGFYLGYKVGHFKLGFINLLCSGLLWFYSTSYKREFLIGNIVTSLLVAMVPLVVGIYEPLVFSQFKSAFYFITGYAVFAFMLSMIREIIKDIQDIKGDSAYKCRTMPIVLGVNVSRFISILITLVTMSGIGFIQVQQYSTGDTISLLYFSIALQIPMLIMMYFIITAKESTGYAKASFTAKLVMLSGVLSMLVFYYSL